MLFIQLCISIATLGLVAIYLLSTGFIYSLRIIGPKFNQFCINISQTFVKQFVNK